MRWFGFWIDRFGFTRIRLLIDVRGVLAEGAENAGEKRKKWFRFHCGSHPFVVAKNFRSTW